MGRFASLILLLLGVPALGQVISYNALVVPENDQNPWVHDAGFYPGTYWVSDGWLYQHCEMATSQEGQQDYWYRTLPEMAGLPKWFLEWRMVTDGPQDFVSVAPASIVAGGFTGVGYHFTIAKDRVRLLRDTQVPAVYANIQAGVAHTYRVEIVASQSYVWYIDGQVIDAGTPGGQYPISSSRITFGDRASSGIANTAQWSYVRYGRMPVDHSGDFDSNGIVDQTDLPYFIACLLAPDYDAAGPSCRWADMNADGKADGADIQLFVRTMTGG